MVLYNPPVSEFLFLWIYKLEFLYWLVKPKQTDWNNITIVPRMFLYWHADLYLVSPSQYCLHISVRSNSPSLLTIIVNLIRLKLVGKSKIWNWILDHYQFYCNFILQFQLFCGVKKWKRNGIWMIRCAG